MAGILSIQFNPKLSDKEYNLNKIEQLILKNSDKKLDLIVFPEFFSTGIDDNSFINYPENEQGGETIKRVQDIARRYNANIVAGSVIEKSEDKLYNTSFFLNRNGEIVSKYRKIHLFNYNGGTEGQIITPGNEYAVINADFGTIGLNICYDLRYPLMQKNLAKAGAELLVFPLAWCIPNEKYNNPNKLKSELEIWEALHRARAYDNLVYVVSCNQTGNVDESVSNFGNSMIVSPDCEILANAKSEEFAIYYDIELEKVRKYRKYYPISEID